MTLMKDLTQFRTTLRAWMAEEGMSQKALAQESGVDQASISRFLRTEKPEGLSGESVLRLYPFVFGNDPPPQRIEKAVHSRSLLSFATEPPRPQQAGLPGMP